MQVAIHTLGCKVNQYETQAMEALLLARGHTLAPFDGQADAYIINSCAVTAVSDKKSRQAVRNARRRAPGAVVAVCGCYPQVSPDQARQLDVDLIGGSGDREGFLVLLEEAVANRRPIVAVDNALERRVFEPLPAGGLEGRTRALLKIEDGCVNFCAYCVIPYARGPVRSLPTGMALAEADRLWAEGYEEIVLTGIEISSWGRDLSTGETLADLVEALCRKAPPGRRLRLGSLEPRTVTEEFCRRLAPLSALCPHFHLSLQSGCDSVLARMGRRYDTSRYRQSVDLLRQWFDRPAITTDLIVGFPGETQEEFAQTLAFLQDCRFSGLHIFPYSRRDGTRAASLPGQISNAEKTRRAHQAGEIAQELEAAWLERWVGETVPVLFEEEKEGLWRGHSPQYLEVRAAGQDLHNQLRYVTLTQVGEGFLAGQLSATQEGDNPP